MTSFRTGLEGKTNEELQTLKMQRQVLLDNVNCEIWRRQDTPTGEIKTKLEELRKKFESFDDWRGKGLQRSDKDTYPF